MRLLHIVFNSDGSKVLMQTKRPGYELLNPGIEVDESYGFDSPQSDIEWIEDYSGVQVFRYYVFFTTDQCISVFKAYNDGPLRDGIEWVGYRNGFVGAAELIRTINFAANNMQNSQTAPWVTEEGYAPYYSWLHELLDKQQITQTESIRQLKNAYVSTVFEIPTNIGTLYMKIPSKIYTNVMAIELFWSAQLYNVPTYIGLSPDGSAGLSIDMMGSDIANTNIHALGYIAKDWGMRQKEITKDNITYTKQLQALPDYTPQKISLSLDSFIAQLKVLADYDTEFCTQKMIHKADSLLGKTRRALASLGRSSIPNTLCHGDIRPGNIRKVNDQYVLYDWGMSFYSHPFYDIAHMLHVTRRQLSDSDRQRILLQYLSAWEDYGSMESLLSTFNLIDELKTFFMAYQDCQWLLEILKACNNNIEKHSMDDWYFRRRFYYFKSVLNRFIET